MNIQISEIFSRSSYVIERAVRTQTWLHESPTVRRTMEIIAVIALSGLAISIYLPFLRISTFSELSLAVLIIWRFVVGYKPARQIPRSVIILSVLFFLNLTISAFLSQNKHYDYFEYKAFKYFIIGGLLYTAPLRSEFRKIILIIFFLSAAVDGLAGILQHYNLLMGGEDRPPGFDLLATYYAAKLAFVPSVAAFMIFSRDKDKELLKQKKDVFFLVIIMLLTLLGLIFSGSRGPLLAFFLSCFIALILTSRKKAIVYLLLIVIAFSLMVTFTNSLKNRITTNISFNPSTSFGNRMELWKGSWLLFKESPLLGIGAGDYQRHIEQLIQGKKLREMPATIHAHNLFIHTLATQGLIGLVILILLSSALLKWGFISIRQFGGYGGYIIILCTVLVILEGLTDYYFGVVNYFSVYYVIIGLLGPLGSEKFDIRIN